VTNRVTGNVTGPVIMAGTVHGDVTVIAPSPVPGGRLATTADHLAEAVGARWRREEQRRRIQDPRPLLVRWRPAAETLTDHAENIVRNRAAAAGPLEVGGDLDRIVDVYRGIPSRRLVVLGRAGAGKTVLALRFVLDLLDTRTPGDPVPVIFSMGSWDPAVSLDDWLVGQLVRDHPGLAAAGVDAVTLAAELVRAWRILPVLDGFDEIADGLHRAALRELSATTMPLVLISRSEEYTAAVAGTRGVHLAAVIELTDLAMDDVADYLRRASAKLAGTATATRWDPVLGRLRSDPHSPAVANLARVLTTPLMVALARTVYSDDVDRDPATLLALSNTTAVEGHLLDSFIPSVYRSRPGNPHPRRWNPERAERWLSYLAEHLRQRGTPDLAWWELSTTMRRSSRTLVIAILAGLVFGAVTGIGNIPVDLVATSLGLEFAVCRALVVGLLHGLVGGLAFAMMYWIADGRHALRPSPVRIRLLGGSRPVRGRLAARLEVGLATGFAVALAIALVDRLVVARLGLDDGLGGGWRSMTEFALLLGLGTALVLAVMTWLEVPIDVRSAVSPAGLLTSNRTNVIFHLLVWALVFGLMAGFVASFTASTLWSIEIGLVFGLEGAFAGGLGYGLSLTAWGQWVALSRIWLPLTRRLPWRLVAFLDDACQRGVLRQVGAVHQFRHAQLQNHLTGTGACSRDHQGGDTQRSAQARRRAGRERAGRAVRRVEDPGAGGSQSPRRFRAGRHPALRRHHGPRTE
jgi:hypothetical protein